jgi:hypothetical protein
MIEKALYNKLRLNAGVAALASTRIFPVVIPQKIYSEATKMPCVVYQFDGKDRQVTYGGTGGLVAGSAQIDSYATTYLASKQLAEAVRTAVLDQAGQWATNDSPQAVYTVQKVFIDREIDLDEPEPGLYRVSQQYSIWYDEA